MGTAGNQTARLVVLSENDHGLKMELGKLLVFLGIALIVAGLAVMLLGRMNFPLGRLPGDFWYRGKHTTVYFPLATSVVLSIVLTILLYVVSRWRR
jgi:Protein of unknown function (DUF2905)